jgi:hypothetical protein
MESPDYMVMNPMNITLDTQTRILSPVILGYASTMSSERLAKHEDNLPKYYSLYMNRRTMSWYDRMNYKIELN